MPDGHRNTDCLNSEMHCFIDWFLLLMGLLHLALIDWSVCLYMFITHIKHKNVGLELLVLLLFYSCGSCQMVYVLLS